MKIIYEKTPTQDIQLNRNKMLFVAANHHDDLKFKTVDRLVNTLVFNLNNNNNNNKTKKIFETNILIRR